jgi:hypothetical protein
MIDTVPKGVKLKPLEPMENKVDDSYVLAPEDSSLTFNISLRVSPPSDTALYI